MLTGSCIPTFFPRVFASPRRRVISTLALLLTASAGTAGTLEVAFNGLQIGIDEQNGSLVRLGHEQVGDYLKSAAGEAGLLDVAFPVQEFVPLRLGSTWSQARISRDAEAVVIRYEPLGPSRTTFKLPEGKVIAEVRISPAKDERSVVFRCRIENNSDHLIPQVVFPDLRGMRPIEGPPNTYLRFASNYPVYPFMEDPIPPHTAQYYVNSGWKEYPPTVGTYGTNVLRWLDYGGYKGGLSIFQKAWGPGSERPTVRTYRYQADLARLRLLWDYKSGIKAGQTWESDEVWMTPHVGGWAKGIEVYRDYVKTVHPQRTPPKSVHEGLGMRSVFMIQAPERDPAFTAFKFTDLPKLAADAKAHGIDQLNLWGWCEYFTLPWKVRSELGTEQEFLDAVKQCKGMGVVVSPFVSCYLLQNKHAERYGGTPGQSAWVYHPDLVPTMDPYYLGPGYPVQFWGIFSSDPKKPAYQEDVLATFKYWIDRGVTSWSWDQVFGDPPKAGGLTDLLFKARALVREKDPEAPFSGEQVTTIENDGGLLDYTWNWEDFVDAQPFVSLFRTPRLNCNIEDSPRIVKAAFGANLYLNAFPRKPDQPNGTALIADKPEMSAALKQVAGLRKQFLPYFTQGTYIGDSVLAENNPTFIRGYVLDNRMLVVVMNNQGGPMPITFRSNLALWLPKAAHYTVRAIDGTGRPAEPTRWDKSEWQVTTPALQPLDLMLYEISAIP